MTSSGKNMFGMTLVEILLFISLLTIVALTFTHQRQQVKKSVEADLIRIEQWLSNQRIYAIVQRRCVLFCHQSLSQCQSNSQVGLIAQDCEGTTSYAELDLSLIDAPFWHWRGRNDMPGHSRDGKAYSGAGTLVLCMQSSESASAIGLFIINSSGRWRREDIYSLSSPTPCHA